MWNTFLNFFCKRDLNPVMNGKKLLFWILLRFRLQRLKKQVGESRKKCSTAFPPPVALPTPFLLCDTFFPRVSLWWIYRLFIHETTVDFECLNSARNLGAGNSKWLGSTTTPKNYVFDHTILRLQACQQFRVGLAQRAFTQHLAPPSAWLRSV